MGTLTYSHTLTAGTNENINDVQDMFNDARTVINGNIDGTNAPGLVSQYRVLQEAGAQAASISSAGNFYYTTVGTIQASGGAGNARAVIINSALWSLTGLTPKLRLEATVGCNATAPAINFIFGLYGPISVAGGAGVITHSLGSALAGSTVTVTTPGASAFTSVLGSDFALPANGTYALGLIGSGSQAANSVCNLHCRLLMAWN